MCLGAGWSLVRPRRRVTQKSRARVTVYLLASIGSLCYDRTIRSDEAFRDGSFAMRLRHALLAAFAWLGACFASAALAGEKDAVRMVLPEGDGVKYWPRWRGPSGQ